MNHKKKQKLKKKQQLQNKKNAKTATKTHLGTHDFKKKTAQNFSNQNINFAISFSKSAHPQSDANFYCK